MKPQFEPKPKDGFELKKMIWHKAREAMFKAQAEGRIKKVYAKPSN